MRRAPVLLGRVTTGCHGSVPVTVPQGFFSSALQGQIKSVLPPPGLLRTSHIGTRLHLCLPARTFATDAASAGKSKKSSRVPAGKVEPRPRLSLPTPDNEIMVKKLTNLLRNKNPINASQFMTFLRKTGDRKEQTILSDKVMSLLPQLAFEDERTRANERAARQGKELAKSRQQDQKDQKAPAAKPKRRESAEERRRSEREMRAKEDADERRKFTQILASLSKAHRVEGLLYVYDMLKQRERQEEEELQLRQQQQDQAADALDAPRWRVDVYMYNLVLDALAKTGRMNRLEEVLRDMEAARVDKDRVTYTILFAAFSGRMGDEARAEQVWREMRERGVEMDVAGYNARMNLFARKNDLDRVLDTYKQMQTFNVQPDQATFSILLECCARDAMEFRAEAESDDKGNDAIDNAETPKQKQKRESEEASGDEEELSFARLDERGRQRILQSKRRRMEAVMRTMKKANVPLDNILINSIVRCYAALGEIDEMFNVVRFLVEEERIKLVEDNYSLLLYCAGREHAIDTTRVQEVFNEMKRNNVQPTTRAITAVLHAMAFAGPDQLEAFVLPSSSSASASTVAAADSAKKDEQQKQKQQQKEPKEPVNLWQLIKRHGVAVTDDIVFDLLKLFATRDVPAAQAQQPQAEAEAKAEQEEVRRGVDRSRMARLLHRMQAEGFGPSSLPVFNALMRFHAAYGDNRVAEVNTLYNQMKKRKIQPNLQTYQVMVDAVLAAERQLAHTGGSGESKTQPADVAAASTKATQQQQKQPSSELSYLLFSEMQSEGVQPNLRLFHGLLELSGLEERRRRSLHGGADKKKGGEAEEDDEAAWRGREEFKQKVLSILNEMQRLGVSPTAKTLKCIGVACAAAGDESMSQAIYDELSRLFS